MGKMEIVVFGHRARCRKALEGAAMKVCENPLCENTFEQTGMAMKPRRFCSDECKQQASLIRRVAALFEGLPNAKVIEILRGLNG